jgi:hypothetical protein
MDSGTTNEPTPTFRRFTADEAMRMVELGIVGEDEHFELLGGEFVDSDPATGDELIRRFTGDEGDEAMRLVESGIIGENEHVELLDGAFVEMSPQGPHTRAPSCGSPGDSAPPMRDEPTCERRSHSQPVNTTSRSPT